MFSETKTRTLIKTIIWRFIATFNSFYILFLGFSEKPLVNAIIMNISGFIIYFVFERVFGQIPYGKE